MMAVQTRHAVLRDRRDWLGVRSALEIDADGYFTLLRVPGPLDGRAIELPPPYAAGASGIAAGPCNSVFVSDTAHHRVILIEGLCATTASLGSGAASSAPGSVSSPRGLMLNDEALFVADSGNSRVSGYAFPALEPYIDWHTLLLNPTAVARDSQNRVYVLDQTRKRVFRFSSTGTPDSAYNAQILATGALTAPLFFTLGRDDMLLVSDGALKSVQCFDADGAFSHTLPDPQVMPWLPGALVAYHDTLYVADAESGLIFVYDVEGNHHAHVHGYRGPVTALAVNATGDLFIKPGLDDRYFRFGATSAFSEKGSLTAGPFDAGEKIDWFSAGVDASNGALTRLTLEVAQRDTPTPAPSPMEWVSASSDQALCALLQPVGLPELPRRYVWLRVTLETADPEQSPVLRQVRAATPGESYVQFLPAIYQREDEASGFLERLLELLRTEISRIEESIDEMPRHFDTGFSRASALPWLAQWLGFELPQIANDNERRELLSRAVAIAERRGTVGALREMVEMYTGIRPDIVEAFEERGLWILGSSSRLGFDTVMPALDPNGMVVPDPQYPDGSPEACCKVTVGSAVVGDSGPLARFQIGEPLFNDTAYRFAVFVPGYRTTQPGMIEEIKRILDQDKPAHTDYRLCIVEPDMRVGFQSRVGIDAIVGGAPAPAQLTGTRLGLSSRLSGVTRGGGRVGQASTIGQSTILG
jgi:phage tail-like protein